MAAKYVIDGQSLDVQAAYLRQMESLFAVLEQRPEMDLNTSQLCSIGRDLAGSAHSQIRDMRRASKSEVSA